MDEQDYGFRIIQDFVDKYDPVFEYDKTNAKRLDDACKILEEVFKYNVDDIVSAKAITNPDLFLNGLIQITVRKIELNKEQMNLFAKAVEISDSVSFYSWKDNLLTIDFFVNGVWTLKGRIRK